MDPGLIDLAKNVRTPLALAGLALLVLFFLFRQMITAPDKQRRLPASQARQISTFLFVLALVAMVLGFVAHMVPLFASPSSLAVFGKVHKAGDRAHGLVGASVFLETSNTLRQDTDRNGDFAYNLPTRVIGQSALVYVKADSYVPSKPERFTIADPMDKIVVGLDPQTPAPQSATAVKPAATNPTTTNQPPPGTGPRFLRTFHFQYQFEPFPGRRDWVQARSGVWIETYPDGRYTEFEPVGPLTLDGCNGAVVRSRAQTDFQVFIPDPDCALPWLRFRQGEGQWTFLAEKIDDRQGLGPNQ